MALLVDTFWTEFTERLTSLGWILVEGSRYDPTHLIGITPTGKAFTLDFAGDTLTFSIAGRSRSIQRFKDQWERGDLTVTAIIDGYNSLPASWR